MPEFGPALLIALSIGFGIGALFVVHLALLIKLRLRIKRSEVRTGLLLPHTFIAIWSVGIVPTVVFSTMNRLRYFDTGFEPVLALLMAIGLIWYGVRRLMPQELRNA